MDTAGVIRTILLMNTVVMGLLALLYLRQRRMSWIAYFGWGLLALLVPVLGPFLVISNRPGAWDPEISLARDARRVVQFFQRMLPKPAAGIKMGRLDRARLRRKVQREKKPPHR
ncbi:MAG TPA: hypothetical protein VF806_02055 [Anaerolineaceae bacterium]